MAFGLRSKQKYITGKGPIKTYRFDPVIGFLGDLNVHLGIRYAYRPDVGNEIKHNDQGIRDVPFRLWDPRGPFFVWAARTLRAEASLKKSATPMCWGILPAGRSSIWGNAVLALIRWPWPFCNAQRI